MNNELLLLLLCPAGVPYTKRKSNSFKSYLNNFNDWIVRYNGLVAWMRAHNGAWPREKGRLGRMSSMSEADAEEHGFAQWVQTQRRRGRATLLGEVEERERASRAELLEQLEGWAWQIQEHQSWMSRYNGLIAWMNAHDGAWPRDRAQLGRMSSMSAEDKEEHRHALWVQNQRVRGRASLLEKTEAREGASRAELLERLEGWAWHAQDSWIRKYDGLVAWMTAHDGAWPRDRAQLGRMSTLRAEDAEEHRLAQWVQNQRRRGGASLLEKIEAREGVSQAELLERLEGWAWHAQDSWIRKYDGLVAWIGAHDGAWPRQRGYLGRMSTLSTPDAEEHRLAQWVQNQRVRGRDTLLTEIQEPEGVSQAELLERLEGWTWHAQDSWIRKYNGLVAWMRAHDGAWPRQRGLLGRMSTLSTPDAEEHLYAQWVNRQRIRGRDTLLTEIQEPEGVSRAELLERLEGWAWHAQESWISKYDGLVAWMRAHGGVWPRAKHRPGKISTLSTEDAEEQRFAQWIHHQRHRGRDTLSKVIEKQRGVSRAELLERLEGWRWGVRSAPSPLYPAPLISPLLPSFTRTPDVRGAPVTLS